MDIFVYVQNLSEIGSIILKFRIQMSVDLQKVYPLLYFPISEYFPMLICAMARGHGISTVYIQCLSSQLHSKYIKGYCKSLCSHIGGIC